MVWWLVECMAANIALASALAVAAWFVGRKTRWQAMAHLLWLIVALKLLTPPLVSIQIPVPARLAPWLVQQPPTSKPTTESVAKAITNSAATKSDSKTTGTAKTSTTTTAKKPPRVSPSQRNAKPAKVEAPTRWQTFRGSVAKAGASVGRWFASLRAIEWLALVLLSGSVIWFARQFWALRRFARMLNRGRLPTDDVIDLAREAADVFGLEKLPRIRVLDLPITPMLWGLGPWTTLLMPARLDHHISRESLKSLVAHELAHYLRGDSWVRLVEFIVTGLQWWNPLVYLARHELERAEEQCCDAMVVTRSGARPRTYAQAILDAIDYVCEAPLALPPVASGLGTAKFLEFRITMIMKRGVDSNLNGWGRPLVAAALLGFIPWTPRIIAASKPEIARPANLLAPSNDKPSGSSRVAKKSRTRETPTTPQSPEPAPIGPRNSWTGAKLRPQGPSQPWARIHAPLGDLAVEVSNEGELRWASRYFSAEQAPFTSGGVRALDWSPDGSILFAASDDGYVRSWQANGRTLTSQKVSDRSLTTMDLGEDGIHAAIGDVAGRVWLYNFETGSIRQIVAGGDQVSSVRFSPDQARLAVSRGDWQQSRPPGVEVIDAATGRSIAWIEVRDPVATAEWTHQGDYLAIASWGGSVDYHDTEYQYVGSNRFEKRLVDEWALSSTGSGLAGTLPNPADLDFGVEAFNQMTEEGIGPEPNPSGGFLDLLLRPGVGN